MESNLGCDWQSKVSEREPPGPGGFWFVELNLVSQVELVKVMKIFSKVGDLQQRDTRRKTDLCLEAVTDCVW